MNICENCINKTSKCKTHSKKKCKYYISIFECGINNCKTCKHNKQCNGGDTA